MFCVWCSWRGIETEGNELQLEDLPLLQIDEASPHQDPIVPFVVTTANAPPLPTLPDEPFPPTFPPSATSSIATGPSSFIVGRSFLPVGEYTWSVPSSQAKAEKVEVTPRATRGEGRKSSQSTPEEAEW
jgi:hypothetical protein